MRTPLYAGERIGWARVAQTLEDMSALKLALPLPLPLTLTLTLENHPLRAQEGTPMPPGVASEARAALRSNPNQNPNHDPNPRLGCALTLG